MNIPATSIKNGPPHCFGKDWDRNAAECAGGSDASYVHPITKLHIRDQCDFFHSCGARTQATRSGSLLSADRLIRPQPAVAPPPMPQVVTQPATFSDFLRSQQERNFEAQRLAAMSGARPAIPITPQQQAQAAWFTQPGQVHPANAYHLNYMMPGYLSTPEERAPGESLRSVLGREIVRALFKALGHAVSHFFDSRRLK